MHGDGAIIGLVGRPGGQLRASVARAAEAFPDAADIYERTQDTMRRLGHEGWRRWMDEAATAATPPRSPEASAD